ncbi:MAG: Npun_F0494 family protein [Cyanobacteria bacterium P01_A01_bin.84]
MSNVNSPIEETSFYSQSTFQRAETALICSPFKPALLQKMASVHVGMSEITDRTGVSNNYTKRPLSEITVENAVAWLIQVGILRREVDGQGITDSFRLTPLGRQLLAKLSQEKWREPALGDRLNNTMTRWLRLPF